MFVNPAIFPYLTLIYFIKQYYHAITIISRMIDMIIISSTLIAQIIIYSIRVNPVNQYGINDFVTNSRDTTACTTTAHNYHVRYNTCRYILIIFG